MTATPPDLPDLPRGEVRDAARHAICDAWAAQPYAQDIGERDRNALGVLAMVDGALDALVALGWRPPERP